MKLNADRQRMLDRAADLVSPARRAVFIMHAVAVLAAEHELSDRRVRHVLCVVLGRFGVAVGVAFFQTTIPCGYGPRPAPGRH